MIAGVGHLTACPPEHLADLLKQTYKTHFEGDSKDLLQI